MAGTSAACRAGRIVAERRVEPGDVGDLGQRGVPQPLGERTIGTATLSRAMACRTNPDTPWRAASSATAVPVLHDLGDLLKLTRLQILGRAHAPRDEPSFGTDTHRRPCGASPTP